MDPKKVRSQNIEKKKIKIEEDSNGENQLLLLSLVSPLGTKRFLGSSKSYIYIHILDYLGVTGS